MNFFGIGGLEWLIIGAIAFFVLGPKSMIEGARTARKVIKSLKEQGNELQQMVKEVASLEEGLELESNSAPKPAGAVARPSGARPLGRIANDTPPAREVTGTPTVPEDQDAAPCKRNGPADVNDRPRPLLEHFRELKSRLMRVGIVGLAFTIAAIVFYEPIFKVLERPAGDALNPSLHGKLAQLDVTETWSTIARVGIIVGLSCSLPYFLIELVAFIRPALKPNERRWAYSLIPAGLISFALGVVFGYFVLLPPAIHFLLTFGSEIAEPVVRISTYVNLIIALMFWMGVVFEIPLVMFFLGRLGIAKARWVAKQRKWALLMAFVLGAIITPTADPVNQALVAGPIIVMYEIGLWLVRISEWLRSRKQARVAWAGA